MKHIYGILFILFLIIDVSAQNTILWTVKHPDSEKISYLLGTYHQIGNSFVDSIPIIEESLLKSEVIIFESIDSKQELIRQMNDRECANEIAEILSRGELGALSDISKNWSVDICKLSPTEIYLRLNQDLPKYLCNTIQPTDTWHHFDNYLMSIATTNNKILVGLETTSFQAKAINEVFLGRNNKHERKRIKMLLKQISDNRPITEVCAQVDNYRNFRIDYRFDDKCSEGIFLKGRNENWMKRLPSLLKQSNCFVVVGLAHLAMECGLIEALRKEGYKIQPVALNKSSG